MDLRMRKYNRKDYIRSIKISSIFNFLNDNHKGSNWYFYKGTEDCIEIHIYQDLDKRKFRYGWKVYFDLSKIN